SELLELLACFAEHAKHFSIERHLVDAAWKRVRAIEHLIGRRSDAKRPGRAGRHGQRGAVACQAAVRRAGLRSNSCAGPRVVERDSDLDDSNQVSVAVEDLNASIAAVRNIEVAFGVGLNRMQNPELSRPRPELAPRLNPISIRVVFGHAGIDVTVTDISVSGGVPGHVRDLPECPVDGWRGRAWMRPWPLGLVRGFLLAAEHHHDAAV